MKLKNPLLSELNRWAYADNILEAFTQPKATKVASPEITVSGPLTGDGIVMGSSGVNAEVAALKEEYVEEYGFLTTEEAKLIFKHTFPVDISEPLLKIDNYNEGQLNYALDVGAYAMYMDYTDTFSQISRLRPIRAVKAALDLWDVPDADDYRDEIEDGFDDLSNVSRAVVYRYSHAAMGHGSIIDHFKSLT